MNRDNDELLYPNDDLNRESDDYPLGSQQEMLENEHNHNHDDDDDDDSDGKCAELEGKTSDELEAG